MNFAQAPRKIPKEKIIAGVETALRRSVKLDPEVAESARAAVANVLRRAKLPQSNITKEERTALASLRANPKITILQADKGNGTVVLDTADYESKAADLLNALPFKRLKKDPTLCNEKRVNDTVKALAHKKAIPAEIARELKVSVNGTRPPLFYGSVKLHKANAPLRPIVSTIGSATYNVDKLISRILSPYVRQAPSYIKNTTKFIELIKEVDIGEDEVMVSFDVRSLFTSVPTKQAVKIIEKVLRDDKTNVHQQTKMNVDAIMDLLELSMSTRCFQFRGTHYELSDGLPMGSPASPCIANIFMADFEEKALQRFEQTPKVWLRFVDDVFSIVKRNTVQKLLNHLNNENESIQFTFEVEKEGKLPFMDVTVHRCGSNLRTSVYRKPTHTGRYLDFASHHPTSAKRSVAQALFNRLEYVTLNKKARLKEREAIKHDLAANGYPLYVQRKEKNKQSPNTNDEFSATATIPYIHGVTEPISRILRSLKIRTVMKPQKMKWSIMNKAKDTLPAEEEPGVVYAIGCTTCKKVYIGETCRTAKLRCKEHEAHARKGNLELSAVANHAWDDHKIHWKPRVLLREGNTMKRKIQEALALHKLVKTSGADATMNQDKGMELSKIWHSIL